MLDYLRKYKAKNPRALRLGLMSTGLSLMKGAGQTYDKPKSTVGLMGEAGLQGLGTYEAARAADITSKEKGVAEAAKERRHIETIKTGKYISEAEIDARESLAKYSAGEAAERSKAAIAAAEKRHLREYGPEGFRRWKAKLESKAEIKTPWESYYTAQEGLGKSDAEIVESFKGLGKIKEPKTPSPVTWTTASKNISHRFGKQDALGNIIITPELQGMNGIAQRKLVELQKTEEYKPLDAVNIAEDFARSVESRYWEYLDAAGRDEDLIMNIKNQFRKKYGYVPKRRAR